MEKKNPRAQGSGAEGGKRALLISPTPIDRILCDRRLADADLHPHRHHSASLRVVKSCSKETKVFCAGSDSACADWIVVVHYWRANHANQNAKNRQLSERHQTSFSRVDLGAFTHSPLGNQCFGNKPERPSTRGQPADDCPDDSRYWSDNSSIKARTSHGEGFRCGGLSARGGTRQHGLRLSSTQYRGGRHGRAPQHRGQATHDQPRSTFVQVHHNFGSRREADPSGRDG